MKFYLIGYILLINNYLINCHCPDDEELAKHECKCNLNKNSIRCSSLPKQCQTCYRYQTIYFDEKVNLLPIEAFRFYRFFDQNNHKSFEIEFAHITNLSINSFSNIHIHQEKSLNIKILQYSSSVIPPKLFENITIQTKGKLNIEIFNITRPLLTIQKYAFDGIKFHSNSQFSLSIYSAKDTIEFESHSGTILLPMFSYMRLYISNFNRLMLNEHSFDHIKQEHSSELRINFEYFQSVLFAHNSLYNLEQFEQSRFYLTLANFDNLLIEQTLFNKINQLNSLITMSIYNLTNDLCLSNKTFNQIKQKQNSTFELEINFSKNIIFTTDSFLDIKQYLQSKFLINIINSLDVYFARYSLRNIYQDNRSLMDIWIKYGQNLIFEDYSFDNIHMNRASILRIGFQHSIGTLQMATNAFSQITQGQNDELLFQIMNSSDFYLRFNQSTSLQRLEIVDRSLSSHDFCRISNIPSHIPVKLLYDNQCSCTIYYLYRHLRHKLLPSILQDITPSCYLNMSLSDIEYAENECSFKTKISDCQQMEGEIQINIPLGICLKDFQSNNLNTTSIKKSSFSSFIFLLIILICSIFSITCIYILISNNRRRPSLNFLPKYFQQYRRQKLPVYSYHELTQINDQNSQQTFTVEYNPTTDQTQTYLGTNQTDSLPLPSENEDHILKLNTNPMSDIDD